MNRFPWVHKEADLVPRQVVGLVLQVGDAEASSGKSLDSTFIASRGHVPQTSILMERAHNKTNKIKLAKNLDDLTNCRTWLGTYKTAGTQCEHLNECYRNEGRFSN